MRHFIKSLSLFLLASLAFISCEKNNTHSDTSYATYLDISPSHLYVSPDGGEYTIDVNCDGEWFLRNYSYDSNYTPSPTSGNGSGSFTIAFPPNYSSAMEYEIDVCALTDGGKDIIVKLLRINIDENTGGSGGGSEDVDPVDVPTGLKASNVDDNVSLSWDAVSNAVKYGVYYSTTSPVWGPWEQIGTSYNNSFSFKTGHVGTYYFVVTAFDALERETKYSESTYCVILTTGGGTTPSTPTPSTPTGLKAVQSGETIVVTWNAVEDAYYYRLWYSTPLGNEDFVNVYAPETSAVFDRNMRDGTYRFWIQALNSNYDESAASGKVSCTFKSGGGNGGGGKTQLDTPTNIEADWDYGYVQISFDQVSAAYEYYLYRSTSPNSGYSKITAVGGYTGSRYVLTDQNPKSGTTYYKVKAIALPSTGIKDSEYSDYVKVMR